MNLAEQVYWDALYTETPLEPVGKNDPIRKWIEQNVPAVPAAERRTCLEIGCFPGRYLSIFGELGYEVHGLDRTPRITELPAWFNRLGFKVGHFEQQDIQAVSFAQQYDVVCSFGFIEHFTNWDEIIEIHSRLVKKGGYLVIETPNFRGTVQRVLRQSLDSENLKRHYLKSMSPRKWKRVLEKHDYRILFEGYLGEFDFWVEDQERNRLQKRLLSAVLANMDKLKSAMKNSSSHYSPYCGIIANKG
ncbi:MAG: class I SAM-dependent methyltransferase [Cytophagales bacterium]|nr:class I SAM-dependent methyltransferase [Cytophagales bacterium]